MAKDFWIEDYRCEPVKEDARRLISGDFNMVGPENAGTPALKAAFESGDMTNFAFEEAGERLTFPAFVKFFDVSHGIVTAVIKPAAAPSPA